MAIADSIGERTDAVDIDAIPAELKQRRRWVCWRYERAPGNEKPKKVPYIPQAGRLRKAKSTDSSTWRSYDEAVKYADSIDDINGIGFMLGDGWGGIDLDDCRDPNAGAIDPGAQAIIDHVQCTGDQGLLRA